MLKIVGVVTWNSLALLVKRSERWVGKAPAILSTSNTRGPTIPVSAIRYDQSRDYYCKCLLNRKEASFKTGEDLDVFQGQKESIPRIGCQLACQKITHELKNGNRRSFKRAIVHRGILAVEAWSGRVVTSKLNTFCRVLHNDNETH